MAVMKRIAIELANLGYDLTAVTLADVQRAKAGETPAERVRRLAAKAIIEGCAVYYLANDVGRFVVTSGSEDRTGYLVDVAHGTCTCDGFMARSMPCKHLALCLAELGELPEERPAA